MRRWTMVLIVWMAAGCGSDPAGGDGWTLGDPQLPADDPDDGAAVEAPEADECVSDSDCGEDSYCHEPEQCGAPRYCEEGYAPVSAAPPDLVCGCDGWVTSANAGYPGAHAWRIGSLGYYGDEEAPCDASAEPPFDFTLRYRFVGEAPEGRDLTVRLNDSLQTDERVKPLGEDGTVEFRATGDQWDNFHVAVRDDQNGDGECSPDVDHAWGTYEVDRRTDLVDFVLEFDVDLQSTATVCGAW